MVGTSISLISFEGTGGPTVPTASISVGIVLVQVALVSVIPYLLKALARSSSIQGKTTPYGAGKSVRIHELKCVKPTFQEITSKCNFHKVKDLCADRCGAGGNKFYLSSQKGLNL